MEMKNIEREAKTSCFMRNLNFNLDDKKLRIPFKYNDIQRLRSEIDIDQIKSLLSDDEKSAVEKFVKIGLFLSLNQVFDTNFEEEDIPFTI